jgi:predicted amidohydrolase YtcJ
MIWTPANLTDAATEFDKRQFQLHIHGVGDAAVRNALDAVDQVARRNGSRDRRPVIAHVIVAQPADLRRFAELGVIPCMTPAWAQANEWTRAIVVPAIGPQRERFLYPVGALAASTVPLSFGSDWPVTTHKPLEGISTVVTRQTANGYPAGGWLPEQRVTLESALRAYTSGPAFQAGRESEAGRLRVGMVADLTQLSEDLFAIDPLRIREVEVRGTWISGVRSVTPRS